MSGLPELAGWAALGGGALVASTIGGVAGFGPGVIMIPLVAFVMGTKATVPVMTVAMLLGNGARVWLSRREIEGRVVLAFLATAIATSVAGALVYTRLDSTWVGRVLGAFMLLAVPLSRLLVDRGVRVGLRHFPIVGAVFGFLSSLVGSEPDLAADLPRLRPPQGGVHRHRRPVHARHLREPRDRLPPPRSAHEPDRRGGPVHRHRDDRGRIGGAPPRRWMSERAFLRVIEALLVVLGLQFLLWPAR